MHTSEVPTGAERQPENVGAEEQPVDIDPEEAQEPPALDTMVHQMVKDQLRELREEAGQQVRRQRDTGAG